jgi:hypothetical protein
LRTVRQPAVAGQFYPAKPETLRETVQAFLRSVPVVDAPPGNAAGNRATSIRAIIAPHAGYPFSGPIAASAYALVAPLRESIHRVLLIGPAHRAPLQGLGASSAAAFATPLGQVRLDDDAVETLLRLPFVHTHDQAHAPEHGLEVHLPFLQTVFDDFTLVPLVAGPCAAGDVATALDSFAGDPHSLIVVSSDLSHYHPYEEARELDRRSAQRIEALQPLAATDACGRYAINGLLHLARERQWQARTVDLRNSGDTEGPRDRVVGYGAFIFKGSAREAHLIE